MTTPDPAKKAAKKVAKKAPEKKAVPATVVGVAPSVEPIKAVVVGDNRRRLGKRLGAGAIALLLLFFGISSYIQSARNGRLLERAAVDRSALVNTVDSLTMTVHEQSGVLGSQTALIRQLQQAVRTQNQTLREAGLITIRVPGETEAPSANKGDGDNTRPQPSTKPTPKPTPKPQPKPSPRPSPRPTPEPEPTPILPVDELLCNLFGICT